MKRKYPRSKINYPFLQVETRVGLANVEGYDANRIQWEVWNPVLGEWTSARICNSLWRKDGVWILPKPSDNPYHEANRFAEEDILAVIDDDFLEESQAAWKERTIKHAREMIEHLLGTIEGHRRSIQSCEKYIEEHRQTLRDLGESPYIKKELQQDLITEAPQTVKKKRTTQKKHQPVKKEEPSLLLCA